MGFIGGLMGGGATGGSNYMATGPTQNQINETYNQVQDQIKNQQSLITQLQGQNGIQNQSNVYNQLQGVVAGTGPNPAQAMLSNQTGANIAAQNALMAGQRGAGSNVGLMARQAAQQGGAINQQAVAQGAQMQAQQSLGALGQAGGLATQQVNQQQTAQEQLLQGTLSQQQAQLGARAAANSANASLANTAMGIQGKLAGGLLGGLGSALGLAHGGEVPRYADGGMSDDMSGKSSFSKSLSRGLNGFSNSFNDKDDQNDSLVNGMSGFTSGLGGFVRKEAGKIGSMFGPRNQSIAGGPMDNMGASENPTMLNAAYGASIDMRSGGHVPGQGKVSGDSLKNDTQPAMLSPKEIVLPRSVTMHPNAPQKAAEFVQAILAKKGLRK